MFARAHVALAVAVAVTVALVTSVGPGVMASAASPPVVAPAVWPTPQQQSNRADGFPVPTTVGLVTGAGTDQSAVQVVKQVLTSAGATRIVSATDQQPAPDAPVDVWVGGPSENGASAAALASLRIPGPAGLSAEGYVLGIGRDSSDQARVVLSGVDATGTFYAAQTLRQLVVPVAGREWLPGIAVRDWPTTPLRGVIEGFYGPPWSTADRLSQFGVITVHVHPRTSSTNIAPTGTATASCVEGDGAYPQFDPKYAIDGDLSTRWSSCYDDNAWLQVQLPGPATIGKVVVHWEAAYGKAYKIETSTDGATWTAAAAVTNGDGGTNIVYLDGAPSAAYVRMQGVARATQYGFSIYELQVYPTA